MNLEEILNYKMTEEGWLRLYRSILHNPVITKSSDHVSIWVFLLCKATYKQKTDSFKGKTITLNPGQLITERKEISEMVNNKINESKVERVIKDFKKYNLIEQQTSNKNRLITIIHWDLYQSPEQQSEQPVNNKRTTKPEKVNNKYTIYKKKSIRNKEKKEEEYCRVNSTAHDEEISKIVSFLNAKAGTNYRETSKATRGFINARLNEGFTVEDFKVVIESKCREWLHTEMAKFIRPQTLFSPSKFESYLEASKNLHRQKKNEASYNLDDFKSLFED